jgi:hypothetical protein
MGKVRPSSFSFDASHSHHRLAHRPQGDSESAIEKLIGRAAKLTRHLIATCHAAFCSLESKIEMRSTSARIALAAVIVTKLENVVNGIE